MEKQQAQIIRQKLTTPLNAKGNAEIEALFLSGGYLQEGYGVSSGAAIDGSHTFKGNQGYYTESGKEVFLNTVEAMREFFKRRNRRLGKPIKYVIKPGIGGQHTPFQGIASAFELIDAKSAKIAGEYELGKDFAKSMEKVLAHYRIGWDQVAVIPSSKSGSTDETMLIFVDLLAVLLEKVAELKKVDGKLFSKIVLGALHNVNFIKGRERKNEDLFKGFSLSLILERAQEKGLKVTQEKIKDIFAVVIGNMFFETTDRPSASRLSAFIRNSGLDKELGEDAPGFGAMYDNVGGRWTGDLHVMTFLSYHGLDAKEYWKIRQQNITEIHHGNHLANILGNRILDEGITDIALVLPEYLFWFGKSIEQNFNESIWQNGFVNLISIRQQNWKAQEKYYANRSSALVINLSEQKIPEENFKVFNIEVDSFKRLEKQELVNTFARLFSIFYGLTNTVGTRLIARAVNSAGLKCEDADLNDLNNPATKIIQANLFLRQPYVELGKGLLEKRLKSLQDEALKDPDAIAQAYNQIYDCAAKNTLQTNIASLKQFSVIEDAKEFALCAAQLKQHAAQNCRKLMLFIYLEDKKFVVLRDYLIDGGVEWVMQGTSDQHISYQQVLAQPCRFLPLIISFVPFKPRPAHPAIGFVKGYLDGISSNLVRDYFAEASFKALVELRNNERGQGVFLRVVDTAESIKLVKAGFKKD